MSTRRNRVSKLSIDLFVQTSKDWNRSVLLFAVPHLLDSRVDITVHMGLNCTCGEHRQLPTTVDMKCRDIQTIQTRRPSGGLADVLPLLDDAGRERLQRRGLITQQPCGAVGHGVGPGPDRRPEVAAQARGRRLIGRWNATDCRCVLAASRQGNGGRQSEWLQKRANLARKCRKRSENH